MSDADAGPSWTDIADWYDALLEAGSGPHETAVSCLLDLVPEPHKDDRVLDVGCGQGLATRALLRHGFPTVIGTDSSERMLDLARQRSSPGHETTYVLDDAQRLKEFHDQSFTGVTCQLALMDIPDLDATLTAIHRVLVPGGWFAFVIGHPCFLVPDSAPAVLDDRPAVTVTGYFNERFWRSSNPNGVRRAGNHHRMLSTYLSALTRAGFDIEEAQEPTAGELLGTQAPLFTEVPIFFAARVRNRAGQPHTHP